jgi:hypothetical protein
LSELRLYADRGGLHQATPWALLGDDGHVAREGLGIADAPRADQALIIVPDDVVSVIAATLPKLSSRQIKAALPAAAEDQLMTSIDKTDLVLLDHRADAPSIIAVWDADWRSTLLDAPGIGAIPSLRVVAESWGLDLQNDETGLLWTGERCVLRLPDWSTRVDESTAESVPPPLIEQSLRQSPAGAAALRFFPAASCPARVPEWAHHLARAVVLGPSFDWRTASFAAAPSLYTRQRLRLDPAATMRALRLPAGLALALLVFEIFAATIDLGRLTLEGHRLAASQETIFRSVMGKTAALVDGEVQLRRHLDEVRPAAGEAGPQDILVLLTRIGSHAGDAMPPLAEIRHENGQLLLIPQSAASGQAWLEAATAAGLGAVVENAANGTVRITP